jgi:hypothetical protein
LGNNPQRKARNRQEYWLRRQAAATTAQQQAAVWYDARRMVAAQKAIAGRPQVWRELASYLSAFYQRHAR